MTATQPSPAPDIFDRRRRAIRRARTLSAGGDFIGARIAGDLIERIGDVQRDFTDVLLVGVRNAALIHFARAQGWRLTMVDPSPALAARHGAIHADEDAMPLEPDSYDLILWPGGLESVNDVPGALLRCRLALRPDGLLLGAMLGDGSLPKLRTAMAAADGDRPAARMHPQISLAALGDLLSKVGLALPVVDVDRLAVAYRSLDSLVTDLRAAALTSVIAGAVPPVCRAGLHRARAKFVGDPAPEQLRILHFSGWAPHPAQPQPARRGSATTSLSAALRPPGAL